MYKLVIGTSTATPELEGETMRGQRQSRVEPCRIRVVAVVVGPRSGAVIESSKPKHNITLTSNIQIKLMALIIEAHMASLAQQEGFGTILSKSLKMNYNIDENFPDRDSAAIFKFFYNNQDPTNKTEFTMEPEFMDDDDPRQEHLSLSRTSSENTQPPSPRKDPRLHRHNTTQQERETDSMVSTLTKEQKQPRDRSSTREPKLLATSSDYDLERHKRRISDEPKEGEETTQTAKPIPTMLYRSSIDHNPIPDNLTQKWYIDEIKKKDLGLKIVVEDTNSQQVYNLIMKDRFNLVGTKIHFLQHDQYIKLPKHSTTYSRQGSKKKPRQEK
ncbi:hypothetical protein FHG87_018278 [Trinorchestia longiramus]|nr:hypothetical protein FHG87_018278 [Trinorchestia longiramus]